MPLVNVNGVRLNVEVAGHGPPIVLLHGLTSSIAALRPEIDRLSISHRTIAVDSRGHGGSDKPPGYTLADHIADVVSLLDHLGLETTALLGRSMGSYIAQGVAIAVPSRISELVLVVPRVHAEESSVTRLRRELSAELRDKSPAEQRRIMLVAMLAATTDERKASLIAAMSASTVVPLTEAEEHAAAAAVTRFDFRPRLSTISARTLVVSGRHDRLNPPLEGELIASMIPRARQVILERSGHLPAIEEREAYLAAIADFLAGRDIHGADAG